MNFDAALERMMFCTIRLTHDIHCDGLDLAEYIDLIPEFMLKIYDYDRNPDHHDLLDEFLAWLTVRQL